MPYLGDYASQETVYFTFTTVSTTGAPTQLAGTPAISVYKDGDITQTTTGVTLTVDFDGLTGLNHVAIATTDAFYATGTDFHVIITTGTVGGTSVVGYTVGTFSITNRSALRPTTAGRTLDVSAGGEAGLDWANIGSPTTVQGLSGTTVKTATDVETDTADIQSRLPAALVGGRIDSSVGAVAANAITAAAIADGAIDAATFAAGAIDATAIANNAIDTATFAAGTTIPRCTLTDTLTTYTGNTVQTGDSFARLGAPAGASVSADVAGVQSDTNDIQTRLPAALVAGRIDASVGAMASGTVTAAAIAADAIDADALAADVGTELATALLDMANAIETGLTPRQALRLIASTTAGKLSGAGTATETFRNAVADSKNRIVATVDSAGNRTAITTDVT